MQHYDRRTNKSLIKPPKWDAVRINQQEQTIAVIGGGIVGAALVGAIATLHQRLCTQSGYVITASDYTLGWRNSNPIPISIEDLNGKCIAPPLPPKLNIKLFHDGDYESIGKGIPYGDNLPSSCYPNTPAGDFELTTEVSLLQNSRWQRSQVGYFINASFHSILKDHEHHDFEFEHLTQRATSIDALSEALIHHAASKWGITKEEFRNGVVMDTSNPILISELVELGYFQFGYIAKSLDPKMLEAMLLKENSKDPALKMTELVLIPIGSGHEQEKMWSVTAEKYADGTRLVMTPHEIIDNTTFVGYARAIRDAALHLRWFNQVIANNALSLEENGTPIEIKTAS